MNNKIFSTLILFTLLLTACVPAAKTTGTASSGKAPTVNLPAQTKLILGAVRLEETNYVVTTEQAAQLLPMFYVLQELNDSKAAAQDEIDGLVGQIQETLTKDQLQAIEDMSLSMQDVLTITQDGSKSSPKVSSTSSGAGGPPDMGGMPGGPGGMPGNDIPSTGTMSASSTSSNSKANTTLIMDTGTPSALFDVAIELLKKKIQ